jgi:hypothetical protein
MVPCKNKYCPEGTPVWNEKKCFYVFLIVSEAKGKYSITPIGLEQHSTVWYAVSIKIFYKIFLTLETG